ncbi:MAG: hypothetical protein RSB78_03195 [Oscillospiraceae bacterium]
MLQGDGLHTGRYSGSSDVSVIGEETGKALDERESANLNIRGTTDNPVLFSESLKRAKAAIRKGQGAVIIRTARYGT